MTSNVYTINEVARHDNINDLWTVMNGKVYDLTKFAKEHPGGEEVLEDVAGKDGTSCFDNIGHSAEAIMRREIYLIGELVEDEQPIKNKEELSKKAEENEPTIDEDDWQFQEKKKTSLYAPVFIAIAIVVYGIIIKYLW